MRELGASAGIFCHQQIAYITYIRGADIGVIYEKSVNISCNFVCNVFVGLVSGRRTSSWQHPRILIAYLAGMGLVQQT